MKKKIVSIILILVVLLSVFLFAYIRTFLYPSLKTQDGEIQYEGGVRINKNGEMPIVVLKGSPEEMGQQHGVLLKKEVLRMRALLWKCEIYLKFKEKMNFQAKIQDIYTRCMASIPERYMTELDAMSNASGISIKDGQNIGFFPELFHCSGIAAHGKATSNGEVVHVRVLDYLRDIGLQDMGAIQVFIPDGFNAWISIGFAGLNGTVTAMNEHGLAIGEIGGRGEGNWDGLTMSYLMRQVMEECRNVEEAVAFFNQAPHTCEFYYVLSDPSGNMVSIYTQANQKPLILHPNEKHEIIREAFEDIAWYTRPSRQEALCKRLHEYYGRINADTMKEIILPPVAMDSNLQDAIFLPNSLEVQYVYAGDDSLACNEKYITVNFKEILDKYRK